MSANNGSSFERPIDRVLAAFPGAKRKSGYWAARCQSHDDARASLSIREMSDGVVRIKCFGGCSKDDALRAVGLDWRDCLPSTVDNRRERGAAAPRPAPTRAAERPEPAPAPIPARPLSPFASVAALAEVKRLPAEFLREQGLVDRHGVEIVYRDADGDVVGRRVRDRVGDSFTWHSNAPVVPYGLDRLDRARATTDPLWIVPTELEVWRLRGEGATAIAVTEPAALDRLEAKHLAGVREIVVAAPADPPGEHFRRDVAARAKELGFAGLALELPIDQGALVDREAVATRAERARVVDLSDPDLVRARVEEVARPEPAPAPARDRRPYATLKRLAEETGLDVETLRAEGVRNRYGVDIAYRDADGRLLGTKVRTRLVAKEGSFWEAGKALVPYGLDHVHEAEHDRVLFVPEGESDTWTARYQGFAAIGIPGASAAKCVEPRHVEDVDQIYAFVEPDGGGAAFLPGLAARLEEIGYAGELYAVRMPETVKDLSALHVANPEPEAFRAGVALLLTAAEEIRIPEYLAELERKKAETHRDATAAPTVPSTAPVVAAAPSPTRSQEPAVATAPARTPAPRSPEAPAPRQTAERGRPDEPRSRQGATPAERASGKVEVIAPKPEPAVRPEQWDTKRPSAARSLSRAATAVGERVRRAGDRVVSRARDLAGRIAASARRRAGAVLGAVDPDRAVAPAPAGTAAPASVEPARPSRTRAETATLTGTPKTVTWAEGLRSDFGRRIDEHLKPILDVVRERAPRERVLRARRHLYDWLARKTEAAWFIDNRGLDGAGLVALAAREDRSIAKRVAGLPVVGPEATVRVESDRAERRQSPEDVRAVARDARERLRTELDAYFAAARARVPPALVARIDDVARATSVAVDARRDARFWASHASDDAKTFLRALRKEDEPLAASLDAYSATAARVRRPRASSEHPYEQSTAPRQNPGRAAAESEPTTATPDAALTVM